MKIKNIFAKSYLINKKTFSLTRLAFNGMVRALSTYAYFVVLPGTVFLCSYLMLTMFGAIDNTNEFPRIIGLLNISSVIGMISNSWFISNWLNSLIAKELKVFKINKNQFFLSLLINSVIFNLISILFLIIIGCLTDIFLVNKNFINSILQIKKFRSFIFIILSFMIMIIFNFSISFLITYNIKSITLVQVLNIVQILFILVFADIIFDINFITNIKVTHTFEIIGYFLPQKSLQWLLFLFASDFINNNKNIIKIIINPFIVLPYSLNTDNAKTTLIVVLLSSICWFSIILSINFYLNNKGENYEIKKYKFNVIND